MARFNTESIGTQTINLAGGDAFSVDPRYELAAILLTSFVKDQYHRSADNTMKKVEELIKKVPPLFAAKAAIYARTEHGMRSISHVTAGEIIKHVKGETWTRKFLKKVFFRPDDMMETLAYYQAKYGRRPIPNALKRAIRDRLPSFDAYRLAKYKGDSKSTKLVDLVNLTHPNAKGNEAVNQLVKGELKSVDTWEAKLSEAGKGEAKEELKKEAWASLLRERRLGYLALLRNLRNIIEQSPDMLPVALEQLTNAEQVKKSMVFPFQFLKALEEIQKLTGSHARDTMVAIAKAVDLSLENVPVFPGRTLVVLDTSGSMLSGATQSGYSAAVIGSLFAAVLYKRNDADFMRFSDNASYHSFMVTDSTISIAQNIQKAFVCGGTNFNAIFRQANVAYDRVVILSDMQGWVGGGAPTGMFADYCRRTGANPKVYSFDLCAYGTLMFPQRQVFALAGVSDRVFEIMGALEEDRQALINRIEAIEL